MIRVFVDIETLPPPEEEREGLSPERVRKLLRRRAQQQRQEEGSGSAPGACTEEEFRSLALHAEYGRLLCVGLIVERDGRVVSRGVLGRDRETGLFHLNEARTLRSFWRLADGFSPRRDCLVGHNVFWDAKFLCKRSRILRLCHPRLSFARYRNCPLYDTMQEWCTWDGGTISLGDLAAVLKLDRGKADGMDGGAVYDAFLAGRHREIADYCFRDVELAREIYYRLEYPDRPVPPLD